MSKEKELLKEILANTKAIMSHLNIVSVPKKKADKTPANKKALAKKLPAKKSK